MSTLARHPNRGRTLALILAGAAAAACLLIIAAVLRSRGLPDAANVAQLLSIPISLVPPVVAVALWWRAGRRPAAVNAAEIDTARGALAHLVAAQWHDEARLRLLDDPDPIPIQWRRTDDDAGTTLTVAHKEDVAPLVDEFRRRRRPRLVVLGEAGAGKTTLAVQIVLSLLDTRPAGGPVPVLLSLAGFDGNGIDDWLLDRLIRAYPGLVTTDRDPLVLRALVDGSHVLPVLDGLDETPQDIRARIITALNAWMDGTNQLILTCRTAEFDEAVAVAGRNLRSAMVLEPDDLTPVTAAAYLTRCLPEHPPAAWEAVIARLRSGAPALAGLASTPLGLWLLRAAYLSPGADPAPLLGDDLADPAALRAHLFGRLIPASIEARPPSPTGQDHPFRPRHRYDPEDAGRWLRYLAVNLSERDTRDFDPARDLTRLGGPSVWPFRIAAAIDRGTPPVERAWSRLGRRCGAVTLGVAAVVLVLVLVAAVASLAVPVLGRAGGLVLAIVVAIAVAAVIALAVTYAVLVVRGAREPDGGTVADIVRAEWPDLRSAALNSLTLIAYALLWAFVTGVVSGVVTALGRPGSGLRIGSDVGLSVGGVILLRQFAGFVNAPEDSGPPYRPDPPWYGWRPSAVLLAALWAGTATGLYTSYHLDWRTPPGRPGTLVVALVASAVLAVATVFAFVAVLAVAGPALYATTSAILAPIRAAARYRHDDGEGDPSDPVGRWRVEALGGRLRLLRVVLMTLAVTLVIDKVWRVWPDPAGLIARAGGLYVSVDVHARYVVVAGLAVVTVLWIADGHRFRWALTAGLVASLVGFALAWRLPLRDEVRVDVATAVGSGPWSGRLLATVGLSGRSPVPSGPPWHVAQLADLSRLVDGSALWSRPGLLWPVALIPLTALMVIVEGGSSRRWWTATLLVRWHAAQGALPPDLMTFLDDAHRLGLLRAVGEVYQFRHADFQDHLAGPAAAPGEHLASAPSVDSA